jgi:flagellar motor switch protein FliM
MKGSGKGGVPQSQQKGVMQKYDPATQQRVMRERLHALDLINERFARHFRNVMFSLLGRSPDVTVGPLSYITSAKLEGLMTQAMNYNMVSMKPLRGTALVSFPNSLISMVIEHQFGGDGRHSGGIGDRELTPTEQRIVERVLGLCMESYKQAWTAVQTLKTEFVRSEFIFKFANIANSQTETLVNTRFTIEIDNFETDFYITFPFSMIDPIKDKLCNTLADHYGEDPVEWRKRMASEIQDSRIELISDFLYIDTSINQLVSMKVGDVLPIDLPSEIIARVDDVPVMLCEYGNQNGRRALRVKKIINHTLPNQKPSPGPLDGASREVKDIKHD